MPGIDRSRVVGKDEEELDEFTCDICLQIFEEPVVTKCCRKTFCAVCINEWLKDNNTCPNDRKRLTVRQLLPAPRFMTNLLNKLKIKCENYTHCQSVLTIEEMANHLKKCNFCDSCKTSQKLLSDNKKTIETLETENEKLKKVLGQSRDELNKFKTFCLKFKQTEEEAIINANNISTPITRNEFNRFSEEEVTYLTNLAKSALSQKSFVNISKFIHNQIELKPDFKQITWVINTNFKESFTFSYRFHKLLKLTFNDIKIVFIVLKAKHNEIQTLESKNEKLQKALGQSNNELSDKQMKIESLKSEIEKLKKDLGQSKDESSGNKSKLNRLQSEVGTLKKVLGQSKGELSDKQMTIETLESVNKLSKTISSKSKQTEEEAIIKANNISTPIKQNIYKKFSEDEVTLLTNLAKSALSQKSFVNISKFIQDQIKLKPGLKHMNWVIITNFKDLSSNYSVCDKLLVLTFNDITIKFNGYKRH